MGVQNLAVKAVVTPALIGGASLAGRRFSPQVGGWLVGLPLTSGPVAFFLASDQGVRFAAGAAVGMLAGTISQVAFALAYSRSARRGCTRAAVLACASFTAATVALSYLDWGPLPTFALVATVLAAAYGITARRAREPLGSAASRVSRWDLPVRMFAATAVVLAITGLAPVVGPHVAGLLSPFPVFGAVLAISTHHTVGPAGAVSVLDGLILGLLAPSVFFLALALTLPPIGFVAFAVASAAGLLAQATSMFAIPRSQAPLP